MKHEQKQIYLTIPPSLHRKALLCIARCYLRCLEGCLNRISKSALIWCAIYGTNFTTSTCRSFQLIWANMGRLGAVNTVSSFLLFISKCVCALMTAAGVYYYLHRAYVPLGLISSPVIPSICVLVLAYVVASVFMMVMDVAVDTIFLCFLVDCDQNDAGTMLARKACRS